VTTPWKETSEPRGCNAPVEYEFAPTDDPRVLAVIERDNDAQISELFDGDAINPIIYVEHRHGLRFGWVAGYDGGEAAAMQKAYDEWGWGNATARRYLWIFHGIAAENADGGYDRDGKWIVAWSTAYQEHVGNQPYATYEEARQDCENLAKEVSYALDGYVYGVGYATNEARRLADDEEIDLLDGEWEISIECWGYVGEEYARKSALEFECGRPTLPEMLPIEVPA
jgi:hypothetical protein